MSDKLVMVLSGTSGGDTAPTTMQSSVTQYGITWTFDQAYPVGQFVNGDYFVVGPVTVSSISPASSAGQNGSMLDPQAGLQQQGFETNNNGYTSSLDVGDDLPLTIQPGSSLVSADSRSTEGPEKRWVAAYAILTVVSEAPVQEAFRPPYIDTVWSPSYAWSDVNTAQLLSLSPTANMPTWAGAEARLLPPFMDFHGEYWGNQLLATTNGSVTLSGYGREIARDTSVAALMINTNADLADKKQTIAALIQRGIDLYGMYYNSQIENSRSWMWPPNGGVFHGRKPAIVLAGALLGDTDMRDISLTETSLFHEDAQTFTVTQAEIDMTNSGSWDPDTRGGTQPYDSSHLGMPEWGIRHTSRPQADNAHWGAYYRQCCNAIAWEWSLAILAMGLKASWNHDVLFDFVHRYKAIENGDADPFGYTVNGQPTSPNSWRGGWDNYWTGAGTWATAMWDQYWSTYYTMPT